MLKIGLILDTSLDPNDGVQQYVVAIGEWLRLQGHDVHFLVGETSQRRLKNIHSLARNFSVTFNGNRTTIPLPTNPWKLRKFIKHESFDILHVQSPHHPLLAQPLILAADSSTAVISTFHILPYSKLATYGTKVLGAVLTPSLRRIDTHLAVSPAAASFAERAFGYKYSVLPNVVDFPRYNQAKRLKKYDGPILTILFLGRLVPRKGCLELLKAVNILRTDTTVPQFRVVICGKGELQASLESYIHEHGLGEIVDMVGYVSETIKPRYYASADIAVFPSYGGESFGIVLLEAMASGNAVVLAGDNPGYRSVMHENADLLFDATSHAQLADMLKYYLRHEKARIETAAWGSVYAKSFDIPIVGRKLLTEYNSALQKRLRTEIM